MRDNILFDKEHIPFRPPRIAIRIKRVELPPIFIFFRASFLQVDSFKITKAFSHMSPLQPQLFPTNMYRMFCNITKADDIYFRIYHPTLILELIEQFSF